jgi:preprotein translocase subunit SecG
LYVEIVSSSDRTEEEYTIRLQRESYTLEVLSVDYSSRASAGDVLPVSVVVKDNGFNDADDVYVVASIPALGVSSRGYVGDLVSIEDDDNGEEDEDAAFRTVYLKVPENAQSGVYEMEITVYNDDAETSVTKLISVGSSASTMILANEKNKDVKAGETVTYEMTIVNSGDSMRVFNIEAVSGEAVRVSVPSAVAVGPDSTEKVAIMVTPSKDAAVGSYTFSVNVDGSQTVFSANVIAGGNVSVSLVAWTVVLVVVFIVLLAVLLVLVTRKEKPVAEEVETSYY